MLRSVALILALASLSAAASLQHVAVRQNIEEDVFGIFSGILGGTGMVCPRNIRHLPTDIDNGVLSHDFIRMSGQSCPDGVSMRVFTDLDAASAELTSEATRETLADYREEIDGIIVGIEAEGRECGEVEGRVSSFAPGTLVMIFSVGEEQVAVGGVAFPPNRTYMVIADPEMQEMAGGFCFYRQNVPPPPSPSPSVDISPVDPPAPQSSEPTPSPSTSMVDTIEPSPSPVSQGTGETVDVESPSPDMDMEISPTETDDAEGAAGDDDDDEPVCFAEDALVELEDGTLKEMKNVVVGDRVKVAHGAYSDVFMFTHRDASRVHKFVRIDTSSGAQLSVTSGHYIYINGHVAAAGLTKVGDSLELGDGQTTSVTGVTTVTKTGLYNPQTVHGDIVVNSIKASTYTRVFEPSMAQALMAPLRVVYRVLGWSVANFNKGADCIADILPRGQEIL